MTSCPSTSTRYFIDGIHPSGAWRCEFPAKPLPYPTPAAAWIGYTPTPTGAALAAESAAKSVPGSGGPPAPPPKRAASAARARLLAGSRYDGIVSTAPAALSSFIASRSTAYTARQKGVVPSRYSSPQLALPQLLKPKNQRFLRSRTFTLAPAVIIACISSRCDVACTCTDCGCG